MSEEPRGPKGGRKHTPGRDHDRKSKARKQKKWRLRQERARTRDQDKLRAGWAYWDNLSDEQKRLLWDLEPKRPRPEE